MFATARIIPAYARPARLVTAGRARATARRTCVAVANKLVLSPTGSGSCAHLGADKVALPPTLELKDGSLDVGRVEPCDLVIPVPTVSSRHAVLNVEGDRVVVVDLGSTNGTMINGADLKAMDYVELPIGGEVIFGDEHLARFRLDKVAVQEEPAPAAPAAAAEEASPAADATPTPVA